MQSNDFTYALSSPVTRLCTQNNSDGINIFAATWSGALHCIKVLNEPLQFRKIQEYKLSGSDYHPVLGLTVLKNKVYYSCENKDGGYSLNEMDLNASEDDKAVLGVHDSPINRIIPLDENTLYSFSWDGDCKIWDLRSSTRTPIGKYNLKGPVTDIRKHGNTIYGIVDSMRIFTMNISDPHADSGPNYVNVINHDRQDRFLSICSDPDDPSFFCIGTREGRLGRYKYDEAKKEATLDVSYKAHCYPKANIVFPANSIQYHPTFGNVIFSGGSDGRATLIDLTQQKTYKRLFEDTSPITQLEFDDEGGYLVVAKGQDLTLDPKEIMRQVENKAKIVVHNITDDDFLM